MVPAKYRTVVLIGTGLAIGAAGLFGLRWLRCVDRLASYHPTQSAAMASGDVERGWLPASLPTGATEIHEEHDLDTNEVWLRFTSAPGEAAQFVSRLRRLSGDEVAGIKVRHPCEAGWWFEALIEQAPANDGALYADVYEGVLDDPRVHVLVAVDRFSPAVYYWADLIKVGQALR